MPWPIPANTVGGVADCPTGAPWSCAFSGLALVIASRYTPWPDLNPAASCFNGETADTGYEELSAFGPMRGPGGRLPARERGKRVRPLFTTMRRVASHRALHWAGAALASLGLSGCATFWEDVTSKDFQFHDLWVTPDPLVVLRDSDQGDKRARALRVLREPKQNGGTDKDQDAIVAILVTAAKSDAQPLCRLAAIQALGHFQDPRAAQGLQDAFFAVTEAPARREAPGSESFAANSAFAPETSIIIQCEALPALGQTKNSSGVELLARVARPGPATAVEASEVEKQQNRDLRLAAVRALGNYSHYEATSALVAVLEKDKDAALQNRAAESLQASTGKDLGKDPKAWHDLLERPPEQKAAREEKKFDLVGWFK